MNYFLTPEQLDSYIGQLIAPFPPGRFRARVEAVCAEAPIECFEMLVSYYAAKPEERASIMLLVGSPGLVVDLPEDLVTVCRRQLFPQVQEHSTSPDVEINTFESLDDLIDHIQSAGGDGRIVIVAPRTEDSGDAPSVDMNAN